jgi:hypothetical protein
MIRNLFEAAKAGKSFLPIIGAGFSAAAGIPVISQVETYLCYCIKQVIERKWCPARQQWPPLDIAFSGPVTKLSLLAELNAKLVELQGGAESDILLAAVGALTGWRDMVRFLSRIEPEATKSKDVPSTRLVLGPPSGTVADSLFAHLTSGREPALAHVMLAYLADALRIRTIVTTNFDRLIELAYERTAMPLEVFEVHRQSDLPHASRLTGPRSLVKMHGNRYGLRVGENVDEIPSRTDEETFLRYLNDTYLGTRQPNDPAETEAGKRVVIAMGVSGKEVRIIHLLTHALRRTDSVEIYWQCFAKCEAREVEKKLREYNEHLNKSDQKCDWDEIRGRLKFWVARDAGHFLFELFQHLYRSMPPAGADFPAIHRVAPEPYPDPSKTVYTSYYHDTAKTKFIARLEKCLSPDYGRLLVYHGASGASSVAAHAFHEFSGIRNDVQRPCHCVWLDLDSCLDVGHFRAILVDAVAQKLGLSSRIPPLPEFTDEACRICLGELTAQTPDHVIVFINGRDGPGVNAGWSDHIEPKDRAWTRKECNEFWNCIHSLQVASNCPSRFIIVVLCRDNREPVPGLHSPSQLVFKPYLFKCPQPCLNLKAEEVVDLVIKSLGESPRDWSDDSNSDYTRLCERLVNECDDLSDSDLKGRRLRFVHALTLVRRSRHPASTLSWAFIRAIKKGAFANAQRLDVDNDEQRFVLSQGWLQHLLKLNAGRTQPGGCFWMHDDVRRELRRRLEIEYPYLKDERAACHQGLADWYLKLFRASNDPSAALESIYHRISCFTDHKKARHPNIAENLELTSLVAAVETLVLARPEIIARGHVRASVRLLKSLQEKCHEEANVSKLDPKRKTEDICRQLTWQCWELRRDYQHEIADFAEEVHMNEDEPQRPNPREDFRAKENHKRKYRLAVTQMGLRDYDTAWHELTELLQDKDHLDIDLSLNGTLRWQTWPLRNGDGTTIINGPTIIGGMRNLGSRWGNRNFCKQGDLRLAVQALRRLMFLAMLRAQVLNSEIRPEAEFAFVCAEGLYVLATAIMRFTVDHDWIQTENVYLRTNLSVALAKLGRFTEATRRLYEASGYLASSSKSKSPLTWAVIDLRRAEVYLERADIQDNRRRKMALLDRAESSLNRAEHRLRDHPADVWWRTFYYELYLRLLSCRGVSLEEDGTTLRPSPETLYKRGRDLIWNDAYRLSRLLNFYLRIRKDPQIDGQADLRKVVRNRFKAKSGRSKNDEIEAMMIKIKDIDKDVRGFIDEIIEKILSAKAHPTGISAGDKSRDVQKNNDITIIEDQRRTNLREE